MPADKKHPIDLFILISNFLGYALTRCLAF